MSVFLVKDKIYMAKSMLVIAGCVVYAITLWSPYYDYVDGWFSILMAYSMLLAPSENVVLTKAIGVVLIIPHVVMLGVLTQLHRIKNRTGCGLLFRVLMSASVLTVLLLLMIGGKAGFTIRYGMYLLFISQMLVIAGCYLLQKDLKAVRKQELNPQ